VLRRWLHPLENGNHGLEFAVGVEEQFLMREGQAKIHAVIGAIGVTQGVVRVDNP
jgi:hypothetical protein